MSKPNDVVKQIKRATRRKFSAEEKIPEMGLSGRIGYWSGDSHSSG